MRHVVAQKERAAEDDKKERDGKAKKLHTRPEAPCSYRLGVYENYPRRYKERTYES